MSKVSVFDHGWIDLVFEGRNQSYGAYQLRKENAKTTILALITGIALMGTLVAIPVAINYFTPDSVVIDEPTVLPDTKTVIFEAPPKESKKPDPVVPQEPAGPAPSRSTATVAHTAFVATSLPVTTPIPTTATILTVDPGTITTSGNPAGTITGTPTTTTQPGTGTGEGPGSGIETSISVDVMPAFPGGIDAFYEQVGRKFRVPALETARTLKVYVAFVVEIDGTMSNIKVGRDPGYGMAEEAIRVLKSIKTKWTPGQKKGQPVRTAYNLPITINVK